MPIHALTQTELLNRTERRQRDTTNKRWTDAEIYEAINDSIEAWGQRVLSPYVYTLTDGLESDSREYTLPQYVHSPMDLQIRVPGEEMWTAITSFHVLPDSGTGQLLNLGYSPPNAEARIVWWGRNSIVPTTVPTLSSTIDADDTSLTVNAAIDIADAGFIKIEQEWIQYAGKVVGASTTTLSNLVRGVFGTTAAGHNSATAVNWGTTVHRQDLFQQLRYQVSANLHALFLTDASSSEKETHQWAMRYWQQKADEYWRTYTPARSPKFRLSRESIGDIDIGYRRHIYDDGYWTWP